MRTFIGPRERRFFLHWPAGARIASWSRCAPLACNSSKFFHNFLPVACAVVAREASQCFGQDLVMMHVLQSWLFRDVQPQTMQQENIFRLHRRIMRANAE